MIKINLPRKFGFIYLVLSFIVIGLLLLSHFSSTTDAYESSYNFILCTFVVVLCSYYFFIRKIGWFQFSPSNVFIIFYIFIFWITPCILIDNNLTLCHGTNVMNGCIEATVYALLSLYGFMISFALTKVDTVEKPLKSIDHIRKPMLRISYIIFFVCIFIQVLSFIFFNGYSLKYIFSFATSYTGIDSSYEQDKSMLFIGYATKMAMLPWLVIVTSSTKLWQKIGITYIFFAVLYVIGSRYMFYLAILNFLIVYCRQKKKTLSLKYIGILLLGLIIFSAYLQEVRSNIRIGTLNEKSNVEMSDIYSTLQWNFEIYQPFYGVVDKMPRELTFSYGQAVFLDPLTMWLPRFLYPDKPEPRDYAYAKAIRNGVSDYVIDTCGIAMPIIGDFYVDFGVFGVFFGSLLLGFLYKKSMNLYKSNNYFCLIIFAIICSTLIQVVNRGFLPSLIPLHVFLLLPILFFYKYLKYAK